MYDWRIYNERLVRKGEIFISTDVMNNWNKELAIMNSNKRGRRYQFLDSFMKMLGYVKVYFGLGYRQTEGLIRTYHTMVPQVPDYTAIHKRINKLVIPQKPNKPNNNIVLAIDSTGIKVTNRGDDSSQMEKAETGIPQDTCRCGRRYKTGPCRKGNRRAFS